MMVVMKTKSRMF